jgi:hypothetical protein
MEPLTDHLLSEHQFLLHLIIFLPRFSFNADQARGLRKRIRAKYLIKANAATFWANDRQIMERHDGRQTHFAAESNKVRCEAHPVMDMNNTGLQIAKIAANSILHLCIIGRKPPSCPPADTSEASNMDTVISRTRVIIRLTRAGKDMALMTSLL